MQAPSGKGARFTARSATASLGLVLPRPVPMLLFRLIFILLLAFIVWRVYRLFRPRLRQESKEHVERMVRCASCETHVPARDALQEGDLWFCCEAHRQAHVARGGDGAGK